MRPIRAAVGLLVAVLSVAAMEIGIQSAASAQSADDRPAPTTMSMSPDTMTAMDVPAAPTVTRVTITGFVLQRGRLTTISAPAAEGTVMLGRQVVSGSDATGINDARQIVGSYAAGGTGHAFLLENGKSTTIDVPGAVSSGAADINNKGQVLGSYTDAQGQSHGYVRSRSGRITTLDGPPGSASTGWHRINDRGQIAGVYSTAEDLTAPVRTGHGFLLDHGRFTTFDAPGGGPLTDPAGINNRGVIVGAYDDANGVTHGFRRSPQGRFETIDLPGASFTSPIALNDRGNTVGQYVDSAGTAHGYLLRHGRVTDIDVPGSTFTAAGDVNNRGDVVGIAYTVSQG